MDNISTEYIKGIKPFKLIEKLKKKEVDIVIDIRWWTYYPVYFRTANLRQTLINNGFGYFYCKHLGNPSDLRKKAIEDSDKDLDKKFNLMKEYYIKYLKNNVNNIFVKLFNYIKRNEDKMFCFICYCNTTDENRCHRFWIVEELKKLDNE